MTRTVAACAVVLMITSSACALDDVDQGAAADAAAAAHEDVAVPDATATDAAADPPIAPAQPPVISASPDPGGVAAPGELAALSAVIVVPVEGVARSQLRDTYLELRGDRPHEALDILAPRGTPVLAATDGRLLKLFDSKPGGLMVYASDPSERFILLYGHLDSYAPGLSDGMPLVRGQVIGYVGTTGNAPPDTPHLHFAILRGEPAVAWWEGVPVNPYPLLVPGG